MRLTASDIFIIPVGYSMLGSGETWRKPGAVETATAWEEDMKILTAAQMGEVDRLTTERYRIPSLLLMENAGRAVAEELARARPGVANERVLILCGTGNNGGDGLVVARQLASRGSRPEVWICGEPRRFRGDALENWKMFQNLGLTFEVLPSAESRNAMLLKARCPDIIVDALFGTGLSKAMGPEFQSLIEWINAVRGKAFVVSVDLPSGVFADRHDVEGITVQADLTVTLTALKACLVFPPAADKAGKVVLASIGSPWELLDDPEYRMELIDHVQIRIALPARHRESHKGTFGHVFALAGSRDKTGAAIMTGLAALRSGAGLVTLLLSESLRADFVGKVPELMTVWLPETEAGTPDYSALPVILEALAQADAVVVGPGLSTQAPTQQLIREVVWRAPVPVVLDADGINAFAGNIDKIGNESGNPIVITPHPGEMSRLVGLSISDIQRQRLATAGSSASRHGLFTILKGFQTVVASPGGRLLINGTGNPGMATGGTGDILAGMIGRFVAGWRRSSAGQDREALADYLATAVHLHGLAADLAVAETGEESLAATDLLSFLPDAFKRVGAA